MLNVIMLGVIMPSVVAPLVELFDTWLSGPSLVNFGSVVLNCSKNFGKVALLVPCGTVDGAGVRASPTSISKNKK